MNTSLLFMNTEMIKKDVIVPAVAQCLHVVGQVKPTKDELILTGKVTAAVAVVTAIGSIVIQSLLRNRK